MTTLSPELLNTKLFHLSPSCRKAEFMNVPSDVYLAIALELSPSAGRLAPLMRRVSPAVRWIRLAASLFAPIAAYPLHVTLLLCLLCRPLRRETAYPYPFHPDTNSRSLRLLVSRHQHLPPCPRLPTQSVFRQRQRL